MDRLIRGNRDEQERSAKVLEDVIPIGLVAPSAKIPDPGVISHFYRGFKPEWADIESGVPARTQDIAGLVETTTSALESDIGAVIVHGPAGSGKSTAARMAAFEIARASTAPCYYMDGTKSDVVDAIGELDKAEPRRFVVVCDRLDTCAEPLGEALRKGRFERALIVGVESQHIWKHRVRAKFTDTKFVEHHMGTIARADVDPILDKLRKYGPWTLLARKSVKERRRVLFDKSKRQLLIGLLESTQDIGFEEIIERDFESLAAEEHRELLIVVGLATVHRLSLPTGFAARALHGLGVKASLNDLLQGMEGDCTSGRRALDSQTSDVCAVAVGEACRQRGALRGNCGLIAGIYRIRRSCSSIGIEGGGGALQEND